VHLVGLNKKTFVTKLAINVKVVIKSVSYFCPILVEIRMSTNFSDRHQYQFSRKSSRWEASFQCAQTDRRAAGSLSRKCFVITPNNLSCDGQALLTI
jgi:hypothetical protein